MGIILTIFITFFIYLFSPALYAKPFGAKLCANDPDYECYTIKKGDTWNNLFANEAERTLIKKINRINIHLHKGMIIAIPKDQDQMNLLDWAPFSHQIPTSGQKTVWVSFEKLAFGAYDSSGKLIYWGPISGGKGYCPDVHRKCNTPRGQFYIYSKKGPHCVSTKYPVGKGGAPMPYCMFFHKGFALHGSYQVPGFNASHGCIRLFVQDAEWLNREFTSGGRVKVIIR